MNNLIEALKEIKKESKDFKITLYKKEVLEITKEFDRLNNIINEKNKEIEDYSNKWCELAKAKTKSDNIINEFEKWLKELKDCELKGTNKLDIVAEYIEDKLQELKGSE